ncbi:MAG: dehypoxanthine futalosine cyclase [Planctomycetes bacterium]|jgi:cyclic dehypoxanthinyl futalosine synthase|nr:dehypoxanthine futalosine cyclase [Planctomycetota bacterium]MDP7246610.1 cyclic dehypoxanthinyl futalosine synthase [Planctomycetota bacterium]
MDSLFLADKLLRGKRLSPQDACFLHENADISLLGYLADEIRQKRHPEGKITYIIDRNLNPTNICVTDCGFCAFYAKPKDEEKGYVLDRETIFQKIEETIAVGGVQILMQGGHHPRLGVEWFCELFQDIKAKWPNLHLHAMSPPEIVHIAHVSKMDTHSVLASLQESGMDSMPGGGAEILAESVREKIAPRKATTNEWLRVMEEAHDLGMRTTATMMFGHVETTEDRIEHLDRLRQLQDRTGGFTAFIAWTFQPGGTPLGEELTQSGWHKPTFAEYFRLKTIARIFLDNFENVQASFVTQGADAATLALRMGCNDFGSAMLEENVVSSAGCFELVGLDKIEDSIRSAGFSPARRTQAYEILPN